MAELKKVNIIKHPDRWTEGEYEYKILDRFGTLCFVRCKDRSKNFVYFAVTNALNRNGQEEMTDMTLLDKESQLSEKTMRRVFDRGVEVSKSAVIHRQREADQELRERQFSGNLMQKRKDVDELFAHLRTELKEINKASENLNGILKNKRAKEILQEMGQIETLLKYGMSFDRNDFNNN